MKKFSKALLLLGIPVTLLSSTIYASPVEQVMPYSASQQLLNEDALKEKIKSNGRAYHTLIIVGYGSGGDFKIAAHTDGFVQNGEPYLLSERNLSNGFIIYNID